MTNFLLNLGCIVEIWYGQRLICLFVDRTKDWILTINLSCRYISTNYSLVLKRWFFLQLLRYSHISHRHYLPIYRKKCYCVLKCYWICLKDSKFISKYWCFIILVIESQDINGKSCTLTNVEVKLEQLLEIRVSHGLNETLGLGTGI